MWHHANIQNPASNGARRASVDAKRDWHIRGLVLTVLTVFFAGVGSSCNLDPVHSDSVDALGPEKADLYPPESEYHRPGEPCALCHSDKGPAKSTFVLGGTVFWGPDNYDARVDNAYVRIVDAEGKKRCFVTNCNGNFYVRQEDLAKQGDLKKALTFPMLVSVERTVKPGTDDNSTIAFRRMSGHIGRTSSCATCHLQGIRDYGSPGQIRMFDSEQEVKAKNIPLVACPPPPEYTAIKRCPEDTSQ